MSLIQFNQRLRWIEGIIEGFLKARLTRVNTRSTTTRAAVKTTQNENNYSDIGKKVMRP
jgi:hypothetical protein